MRTQPSVLLGRLPCPDSQAGTCALHLSLAKVEDCEPAPSTLSQQDPSPQVLHLDQDFQGYGGDPDMGIWMQAALKC